MKSKNSIMFVVLALTGCQGGIPGMSGLGQPGRVPPPATGSYQVPGAYSGSAGAAAPTAPTTPPSSLGSAPAANPWVDQVASAQNQLKQATDSARAAVFQSTQNLQNQVDQAASRADRIGTGVVQASQVLSDAALSPLPTGTSSAPSSLSTPLAPAAPADDPNAQWRKPTPR